MGEWTTPSPYRRFSLSPFPLSSHPPLPGNETGITKENENNGEIRMTKLEGMTNNQMTKIGRFVSSAFGLRHLLVIRHSCFVISGVAILTLMIQMCCTAPAQAQSPNMTGRWNVGINFADGSKRSLRFDAQDHGKGTFLLVDPMLSRWGPAKPSEAKWTPGDQNSVTFSGAVEFPLGNVGRDPGTLMFKGKFGTPDSISGEVEFAPLVGDRPSKHGTFQATRAGGSGA